MLFVYVIYKMHYLKFTKTASHERTSAFHSLALRKNAIRLRDWGGGGVAYEGCP